MGNQPIIEFDHINSVDLLADSTTTATRKLLFFLGFSNLIHKVKVYQNTDTNANFSKTVTPTTDLTSAQTPIGHRYRHSNQLNSELVPPPNGTISHQNSLGLTNLGLSHLQSERLVESSCCSSSQLFEPITSVSSERHQNTRVCYQSHNNHKQLSPTQPPPPLPQIANRKSNRLNFNMIFQRSFTKKFKRKPIQIDQQQRCNCPSQCGQPYAALRCGCPNALYGCSQPPPQQQLISQCPSTHAHHNHPYTSLPRQQQQCSSSFCQRCVPLLSAKDLSALTTAGQPQSQSQSQCKSSCCCPSQMQIQHSAQSQIQSTSGTICTNSSSSSSVYPGSDLVHLEPPHFVSLSLASSSSTSSPSSSSLSPSSSSPSSSCQNTKLVSATNQ